MCPFQLSDKCLDSIQERRFQKVRKWETNRNEISKCNQKFLWKRRTDVPSEQQEFCPDAMLTHVSQFESFIT